MDQTNISTASPPETASGVSLGYGIAIAVSLLILISTIMLASYACVRVKTGGGRREEEPNRHPTTTNQATIMVARGLDIPVIRSYPTVVLGQSRRLPRPNSGPCSICLSEYNTKDVIRCMPECNHCFHAKCIEEWLKMNASCPLCRSSPAPSAGSTPVTTPLSELVPLAYHMR